MYFSDVAARQVRDSFKVAAFRFCSTYLSCDGASEVAEQQILAGNWKAQQSVQEAPKFTAMKTLQNM